MFLVQVSDSMPSSRRSFTKENASFEHHNIHGYLWLYVQLIGLNTVWSVCCTEYG